MFKLDPLKRWKNYVFEFFMLFIAITLGFFVENKREYYSERAEEVEYMHSLIEDLRLDTAALSENIRIRNERIHIIDSLAFLLSAKQKNEFNNDIYYYARIISIPTNVFPNDRTIQQLKNSGRLRLINNNEVSNTIINYYQTIQRQMNDLDEERGIRQEYRILVRKVFDGNVLNAMTKHKNISRPTGHPDLMTTDPYALNEFVVQINYIRKSHQIINGWSAEIIKEANELIKLIETEYQLN